jgi:Tol biopolymer transport system component
MKADGKDQTLLTRGSSATWSPNGKYIAFHRSASGTGLPIKPDPGAATTDSDIFIMRVPDLDDDVIEEPTNITNTPGYIEDDADWSPDGEKIVFTRHLVGDNPINSNTAEICKLTLETLEIECLTQNSLEERAPTWSPDGTEIAHMCKNDGGTDFEICVMDADGSGQTPLTSNTVLDATPGWSPDGTKIVSARGPVTQAQIWLMKADEPADQTQLVIPPLPIPPGPNPPANWAPSWGQLWVGGGGSHLLRRNTHSLVLDSGV